MSDRPAARWLFALALGATASAASATATSPTAVLASAPNRVRIGGGEEVRLDILVDIGTGQTNPGCVPPEPLHFAGYQVGFAFDSTKLQFLGDSACPDTPPELGANVTTSPHLANTQGGGLSTAVGLAGTVVPRACYFALSFLAIPGALGSTRIQIGEQEPWGATILLAGILAPAYPGCPASPYGIGFSPTKVDLELVGPDSGDPALGDLNLDTSVDVLDAVTMASGLVGNTKLGEAPFAAGPSAADINGDRTLDVFDLVGLVANIVQGPSSAR